MYAGLGGRGIVRTLALCRKGPHKFCGQVKCRIAAPPISWDGQSNLYEHPLQCIYVEEGSEARSPTREDESDNVTWERVRLHRDRMGIGEDDLIVVVPTALYAERCDLFELGNLELEETVAMGGILLPGRKR